MSTDIATTTAKPEAIAAINDDRLEEQRALIRRTVCPTDLTDDEFRLFCEVAKRKQLDPLQKQIYAVKRNNRSTNRRDMTIQTGIDGYRLIAHRRGLAGIDAPIFSGTMKIANTNQHVPAAASVTVYRRDEKTGERDAYTGVAHWGEYYPGEGNIGAMWRRMPKGQLAKCAEALALRKGFQELGGLYTAEEMAQADRPDAPAEPPPARQSQRRHVEAPEPAASPLASAPEDHSGSQPANDAIIDEIRRMRMELDVGWIATCQKVLGYEVIGRVTQNQALLIVEWLRKELQERKSYDMRDNE